MAVKFPLEVKNGVKARNISELRENFDIEKVVGYFLDGKLKNWLDARYYEDEAEAIEQLSENDAELARKLCAIFDVEYDLKEIDQEEIAKRNERLARLKQFTADEEIINNIDCVAFDQEELAGLYDSNAQLIFLCEGPFVIPKSKSELEYILIADPEVNGLKEKLSEEQKEKDVTEKPFSAYDVPVKIADRIGIGAYLETKNYMFYRDGFAYYKYNKNTNKEEQLTTLDRYGTSMVGDDFFIAYEDCIILEGHLNLNPGKMLLVDLADNKYEEFSIYSKMWGGGLRERIVNEKKLAYYKDEDVKVLDLTTGESEFCFETWNIHDINFILHDNRLFVFEKSAYEQEDGGYGFKGTLYCLDINNCMKKTEIYTYKDNECCCRKAKFYVFNNNLYMILYQDHLDKKSGKLGFKVLKINSKMEGNHTDTILDLNGQNIGFLANSLDGKSSKYIPFVNIDDNSYLSILDLDTYEVKKIATDCAGKYADCNHYQIVGNYLYYEKGSKGRLYRLDLRTGHGEPVA